MASMERQPKSPNVGLNLDARVISNNDSSTVHNCPSAAHVGEEHRDQRNHADHGTDDHQNHADHELRHVTDAAELAGSSPGRTATSSVPSVTQSGLGRLLVALCFPLLLERLAGFLPRWLLWRLFRHVELLCLR